MDNKTNIEKMRKKSDLIYEFWTIIKYQIMTKIIMVFIFGVGMKWLFKQAMNSLGKNFVTSGDLLSFIGSWQGLGIILSMILFAFVIIGTDINAFIIMSAGFYKNTNCNIGIIKVFKEGVKSVKKILSAGGILLVIFIFILISIIGIGYSISILDDIKLPNFITNVINNTPTYKALYIFITVLFMCIMFLGIFTLHFTVIGGYKLGKAFKYSVNFVKNNFKVFFRKIVIFNLVVFILLSLVILFNIIIMYFLFDGIRLYTLETKVYFVFVALIGVEIIAMALSFYLPIIIRRVTKTFYELCHKEDLKLPNFNDNFDIERKNIKYKKRKISIVRAILLVLTVLCVNVIIALAAGVEFDSIFRLNSKIQIVAHRGGGDLAAENSVAGVKKAYEKGAKWSEIDVQRTKDGHYIINHDKTFKRLSGVNKKPKDMTLGEIKRLKIENKFDKDGKAEPVATLHEMLAAAKGKIGMFIELKGETADKKMVDDVVEMVKKYNMVDEVAILSLDYKIIEYVKDKFPEIRAGFLYYFAFGDFTKLKGDFLVMEEGEATEDNIDKAHKAGKAVVVWTVNTEDSMNKFVRSKADGVITDHVLDIKEVIEKNEKGINPTELLLDFIFS